MNEMHHEESGSTAPSGMMAPSTMHWARLKGAAFLTGICIAVIVSMVGWLGGLALVVLEICQLLFS